MVQALVSQQFKSVPPSFPLLRPCHQIFLHTWLAIVGTHNQPRWNEVLKVLTCVEAAVGHSGGSSRAIGTSIGGACIGTGGSGLG